MDFIKITKKEKNFTQIDNNTLQDQKLSLKAKGILSYLLSKPKDWKPQIKDIANNHPDGKKSIQSGLKELEQCGYAKLIPAKDETGRIVGSYWHIAETPELLQELYRQTQNGFTGEKPNNSDNLKDDISETCINENFHRQTQNGFTGEAPMKSKSQERNSIKAPNNSEFTDKPKTGSPNNKEEKNTDTNKNMKNALMIFFGFNELKNEEMQIAKHRKVKLFVDTLNQNGYLKFFAEQFYWYKKYKYYSNEKIHQFDNFIGSNGEKYIDGGWNNANWKKKLEEYEKKQMRKNDPNVRGEIKASY